MKKTLFRIIDCILRHIEVLFCIRKRAYKKRPYFKRNAYSQYYHNKLKWLPKPYHRQ